LVPVVLDRRVLGWGLAMAGYHLRVPNTGVGRRGGADQPDAEVPLVAVVEQEQELLASGDVSDAQSVGCPRPAAAAGGVRRRRAGVLGGLVPGLAAEEERPQMRVVEAEGQWDGLAQVAERLVAGELKLTPDLPGVRWSVEAAEDADAERVGRWRDRRSGRGISGTPETNGW
ncbi:MAG TPA: hypothetical protein VK713_06540, partial [Actinomycetes bacterium]|nr:hypothetical protein [Actinomycetes bacterium]